MLFQRNFINIILIALATLAVSCRQKVKPGINAIPVMQDTTVSITAKQPAIKGSGQYPEIYAFIKELIRQKDLDTTYGLIIEPAFACDLTGNDNTFLKTLLIEKKKEVPQPETESMVELDSNNHFKLKPIKYPDLIMPVSIDFGPQKCLTKKDIRYMLDQKPDPDKFKWDADELGFDNNNDSNYYSISIPLFSLDHIKAVVMIESLCPGLCGTGNSYVYIKKKNRWVTTNSGLNWVH